MFQKSKQSLTQLDLNLNLINNGQRQEREPSTWPFTKTTTTIEQNLNTRQAKFTNTSFLQSLPS